MRTAKKVQPHQARMPLLWRRILLSVTITASGVGAYFAAQFIGTFVTLAALESFDGINKLQAQVILYVIVHGLLFVLLISLARLFGGPLREVLGIGRVKNWNYALLLPLVYVLCFIVSAVLSVLIASLVSGFQIDQAQNLGLPAVADSSDALLVGLLLVVFAPLAEEFIFRGYLFGMLRRYGSFLVSAIAVSLLFGLAHGQWNVGIVTFVLSMALCYIRERTGSIWTGMGLHALQNLVAFLLLYVYDVI